MLLTKASEYALLSLIVIAQKNSAQDVDTLATNLGISKSFLAKVLQSLAKEKILVSFKGAKGGFRLSKDPKNINMRDIIECVEKKPAAIFECSSADSKCKTNRAEYCKVKPFFNKFQNKVDKFLESITLFDIIENQPHICD